MADVSVKSSVFPQSFHTLSHISKGWGKAPESNLRLLTRICAKMTKSIIILMMA